MVTINETYSLITVLLGFILVFFYIYGAREIYFRNIIFMGFALRVILLLADYFKWFPILNSGADSELFHMVAANNVKNYTSDLKTNYTIVLTFIYHLTDCSRIIAQFLNVLMGLGIILMVQSVLKRLDVDLKRMKIVMLILAFMPNLNIFSAILLREAWVEFFIALSLVCFVNWFLRGGALYIVLSIAAVLSASFMHAGVIGVLIGYTVAYIIYNPTTQKVTISRNTIISLVFLLTISSVVSSSMGLFTGKFAEYDNIEDIVHVTNRTTGGGSDYLTWISTNSVTQSLLFAPLKMIYFLFSPLPTEWRGANDMIGFLIDGAIYLMMFITIFKCRAATGITKQLKRFLMVSIVVVTFIFGYGTTNAGTAFRHRNKIVSIVVVTFAISTIKTNKYEQTENRHRSQS